jgi:hypothetical protein
MVEEGSGIERIPEEARKAAEDFLDQNPLIVEKLKELKSAQEVWARKDEFMASADVFFTVRKLDKRQGRTALHSALMMRWGRMHPN